MKRDKPVLDIVSVQTQLIKSSVTLKPEACGSDMICLTLLKCVFPIVCKG